MLDVHHRGVHYFLLINVHHICLREGEEFSGGNMWICICGLITNMGVVPAYFSM